MNGSISAVFGLRQQEPGDEGAERHREAARRGGQAVAQHHQETGGHEEFGALRLGHEMKEQPQRNTPEDDQRSERQRGWNEGAEKRPAEPALAPARDGAGRHEKGRYREILKQQHREARPADGSAEPLALDEDRDHDRRRGHGERRADRRRGRRGQAERPGDRAERQRRDDDLPEPEPEHQPARQPQPLERQFEPHGEQERDDAARLDLCHRTRDRRFRFRPNTLFKRGKPFAGRRQRYCARGQVLGNGIVGKLQSSRGPGAVQQAAIYQHLDDPRRVDRFFALGVHEGQDIGFLVEHASQHQRFNFAGHKALAHGFDRRDRGGSQHVVGVQIELSRP